MGNSSAVKVGAIVDAMVDTMVDAMVDTMVDEMVDEMVAAMADAIVDAMVGEPAPSVSETYSGRPEQAQPIPTVARLTRRTSFTPRPSSEAQ